MGKKWYEKNKEVQNENSRAYHVKNKEKIRMYRKQYYLENWYFLNKYQEFGMGVTEARKMPRECESCGDKRLYVLHWHHKDLNHKNNARGNIQVLCANCHMEHHYLNSLKVKI